MQGPLIGVAEVRVSAGNAGGLLVELAADQQCAEQLCDLKIYVVLSVQLFTNGVRTAVGIREFIDDGS